MKLINTVAMDFTNVEFGNIFETACMLRELIKILPEDADFVSCSTGECFNVHDLAQACGLLSGLIDNEFWEIKNR